MNVIVGSDASTHLTESVLEDLRQRGHQVNRVDPLSGTQASWPQAARTVAEAVASGEAEMRVCSSAGPGPA